MKVYSRKIVLILTLISFLFNTCAYAEFTPTKDCWNNSSLGSAVSGPQSAPAQSPNPTCSISAGQPVNIATGNETHQTQDIKFSGRGFSIDLSRNYNSLEADQEGPFGYGFSHSYDQYLLPLSDGTTNYMLKILPNGQREKFTAASGNAFNPEPGNYEQIVKNADLTYTLTKKNGDKHNFDQAGRMISLVDRYGNTLNFGYDPDGKLLTITDSANRAITFTYNSANKVSSVADSFGRVVNYSYDTNNNLIKVTQPATLEFPEGVSTSYTYDDQHRLLSMIDANNQVQYTNIYDANNRVVEQTHGNGSYKFIYDYLKTTVTDPRGFKTIYYLNPDGTTQKKVEYTAKLRGSDPASYTTTYEYLTNSQISKITYPDGRVSTYSYDANGNILTVTHRPVSGSGDSNLITTYTYNTTYNTLKTVTDPKGYVTTYYYDFEEASLGDLNGDGITNQTNRSLIKVVYPAPVLGEAQPTEIYTYNNKGDLQTVTDQAGVVTKYEYAANTGYLTRVVKDYGGSNKFNAQTVFSYDNYGNMIATTNALGQTTEYEYNELNELAKVTGASCTSCGSAGSATKYSYDAAGNMIKMSRLADSDAERWLDTEYIYDNINRLIETKQTLGAEIFSTRYEYDANGNRTKVTDANGNTTSYFYDERNLLYTVTDGLNNVTKYNYDLAGNLKEIVDAKGNTTTYQYDGHNRLKQTSYPDTTHENYAYDLSSNLIMKRTRKGDVINYVYDRLNRLTTKTYPDASSVSYSYDLASRLTSVNSSTGALVYSYDNLNRVLSTSTQANQHTSTLNYEYDLANNRTKLVYPDGTEINYVYDNLNRLTRVHEYTSTLVNYVYDDLNRLYRKTLGNGVYTDYTYDDLNRLTNLVNKKADATVISNFDYTHDNVGNRISKTTPTVSEAYGYDAIYQLTSVTADSLMTSFAYDKLGNRSIAEGKIYTANNLNQYTQVDTASFGYDANGNMNTSNGWTYGYDYENRLISTVNGTTTASYAYDPMGRRIQKAVDGVTTNFIYDNDQIIAEADSSGNITKKYVNGQGIDEILMTEASGQKNYFIYDGLGSVTEITDSTGTAIEKYRYQAFGQTSIVDASDQPLTTSSIGNTRMFTGRELDAETGLYHYRARAYSSEMGRFLQEDPILSVFTYKNNFFYLLPSLLYKTKIFNPYTYAYNQPLNKKDPHGLYSPQKAGCDVVNVFFPPIDEMMCFRSCCDIHDTCYTENKCSAKSWSPCNKEPQKCKDCNRGATWCFVDCIIFNNDPVY